jgi:hypothetical protein
MEHMEKPVRRRLHNRTEPVKPSLGLPPIGAFLFGLAFFAAGTGIGAIGMQWIPVETNSSEVPDFVLPLTGLVFASVGGWIWILAWRENRFRNRLAHQAHRHACLADYPWDLRGAQSARWGPVVKGLVILLFFGCFMAPFNWWAFFSDKGHFIVASITVLFDAVLLYGFGAWLVQLTRAIRFGPGRVHWDEFPLPVRGPVRLRWQPGEGVTHWSSGRATLRCVEEFYETRGHGKNRRKHLCHEEIGSVTIDIPARSQRVGHPELTLDFSTPPGCPPTKIQADRPVFWEVELELETPGVNPKDHFLVPVY